jgi:hypothetical protein
VPAAAPAKGRRRRRSHLNNILVDPSIRAQKEVLFLK